MPEGKRITDRQLRWRLERCDDGRLEHLARRHEARAKSKSDVYDHAEEARWASTCRDILADRVIEELSDTMKSAIVELVDSNEQPNGQTADALRRRGLVRTGGAPKIYRPTDDGERVAEKLRGQG